MERSKNESRPTMMAFSRQAVDNLPNSSIENTLKGERLGAPSATGSFGSVSTAHRSFCMWGGEGNRFWKTVKAKKNVT